MLVKGSTCLALTLAVMHKLVAILELDVHTASSLLDPGCVGRACTGRRSDHVDHASF